MSDIIEFKPRMESKHKVAVDRNIKVLSTWQKSCDHAHIVIDESLNQVECTDCGQMIDPMWFLKKMAHKESAIRNSIHSLSIRLGKLQEKTRCKCEKCGGMTRIDRSL